MDAASTLQERIDAIAYPPTHTYRLDTLTPTSYLAERVAVIAREFPQFFGGANKLLDVGCNKGFFALYHDGPVLGIDPDPTCVDLCRKVCPDDQFIVTTFGHFETTREFDRVFIGNGPHYPFIEAGGWAWVAKLAKMSKGQVLLEGPIGMSGRDAQRCIPPAIAPLYNPSDLHAAFEPWFFFRKQVPSPLVDRFFTLFEKKDELFHASPARYADYLVQRYQAMAPELKPNDVVMEICTRHDRGVLGAEHLARSAFIMVDRNPARPGLNLDAVTDELPACDVLVSTAILHHTAPTDIPRLLANLAKNTRRLMIFTGPNRAMLPDLFGDHAYHIDVDEMRAHAAAIGWRVTEAVSCGLSEPFCEVMLTLCRA